ncbi:MAG: PQQ-binding-like beta-propeller repeat protein [Phycisphaerae bacterium]|nr:PQQ-binding-like beta-propeller repeat protein [Phycisphaerae bacterium]
MMRITHVKGANCRRLSMGAVLLCCVMVSCAAGGDWAQWRGPFMNGSSDETNLPEAIGPTERVVWVSDLPGPSSATPIVCGGRVFVTSMEGREGTYFAMCFDAATGKELWREAVGKDSRNFPRNNMATPSAVTDGRIVVFLFGSGEMAGMDRDGGVLWRRSLEAEYGELALKYGFSSSPLLHDGVLYVPVMRRSWSYRAKPEQDGLESFLLAVDPKTGENIWKVERKTDAVDESMDSYSTPIVFEHAGRVDIVLLGGDYVTGHDARTGAERWRYAYNPDKEDKWRNIPSAVPGEGLLFAVRARGGELVAIKGGCSGTVGDSEIAWRWDGLTTDSPTPAYAGGLLYVLYGGRTVTCLDGRTGKEKWQGKLSGRGTYYASPTVADGKVYCISETGDMVVLAAGGDAFRVISQSRFDEGPMQASVAAAGGRLFLRTARRLYCFGK